MVDRFLLTCPLPKTAVITLFVLWDFMRIPLGLKNAGQTFQRFMDDNWAGILHVIIYLDDVLVASPMVAENKADLQRVMERRGSTGWSSTRRTEVDHCCQGGSYHQVPQAVHVLPTAELPGDDQLLHEVHQEGGQHLQAAD